MTNARIATVTSAGRDSGSRMRRKNLIRVAPSTTAASSISAGMARMNGRRITIVMDSENAASGIATPNGLSSRPMRSSSRYSGRLATPMGNSSPTMNTVYRASRPLKA